MINRICPLLLGVYFFLLGMVLSTAVDTLYLELLSTAPPSGVAGYVNPSFAGFGIEPSNLFSFTGREEPNQLTINLLHNLANYTGQPPHIRIGGNTADYMVFDHLQNEWDWVLNDNQKGQGIFKPNHMVIGPRFFEAVNRFPPETPLTWGLNMAYNEPDWENEITTMAHEVITRLQNLNLVSFELGNEPDLWLANGFRSAPYGGREYVEEWILRAQAVYEMVLKPNNIPSNFFEVGCTASTVGTDFQIIDLVSFDANRKVTGSDSTYVAAWNQHDYYYFIGVSSYPLTLEYLMQLSTTEIQFAAWVEQVQQSQETKLPYAVREMGVVGPIGMEGTSDVFGGAIWTLNFLLYTSSLGISSIQFHMTDNSNASAWQPVAMYDREPFVRPLYYGMAAFDHIIGSACSAQVSRPKVASYPDGYEDFMRTYTVYQGGQLDSIVVINGRVANVSDPNKASADVSLKLSSSLSGQLLHLSYLTSDGADAVNDTIWNGISYEKTGDGTPTRVSNEDKTAQISSDGTVNFSVRDSEAIVATIGRRIGDRSKPDQVRCGTGNSEGPAKGGHTAPLLPSPPKDSVTSDSMNDDDLDSAAAVGSEVSGPSIFFSTVVVIAFVAGGFAILG